MVCTACTDKIHGTSGTTITIEMRKSILATLKQLAQHLSMTEKKTADRLDDIFRLYQLEKKWFKKGFSEEGNHVPYEFNETSYEIMKVLLKAIDYYPLVRSEKKIKDVNNREKIKNSMSVSQLQNYYRALIESINEIENQTLRVKIKKSPSYEKTIVEVEGLQHLSGKFSHFLAASNQISETARMQLWTKLYQEIDGLIYECYDAKIDREEQYAKKREEIIQEYQNRLDIIQPLYTPYYDETLKGLKKQRKIELQHLDNAFANENTYDSLDQFLVDYMLLEAYKHHYKMEGISLVHIRKKPEKLSYGTYNGKIIKELVEKEEQECRKPSEEENEICKLMTEHSFAELLQLQLDQSEKLADSKKEELESYFKEMKLTEFQAKELLQTSELKANDYVLGKLERRMVGPKLRSIYNDLLHLHEDVSGALFENLSKQEQNDYQRVLEVVEQSLASIDLLNEPSKVREGKMKDFYEGYLTFYNETKQQSKIFETKAQAFTMSTSIEALEIKLSEEEN